MGHVCNVFNNSHHWLKVRHHPPERSARQSAMSDWQEALGDGRRFGGGRKRQGSNRSDGWAGSPRRRNATSGDIRRGLQLTPGPGADMRGSSWNSASSRNIDSEWERVSVSDAATRPPATADLPTGAAGAGPARPDGEEASGQRPEGERMRPEEDHSSAAASGESRVSIAPQRSAGRAKAKVACGAGLKRGWGITATPPSWKCDEGSSMTVGNESPLGPLVASAVKRMVVDPSEPDYPRGLFRHHGTDRTLDRTYEQGGKPFEIGDGIWVSGHPSSADWPRTLTGPTYQWDPAPSINKYDDLNRGRAARVTLTSDAATEDNMALCFMLLSVVNGAPVQTSRTDWKNPTTENGWVGCGVCRRICDSLDYSLRVKLGAEESMLNQNVTEYFVCPVCIRDNCGVRMHEIRLFLRTLRGASSIKRGTVVKTWLGKSQEDRNADISVIQAPADLQAVEDRGKRTAGALANSPSLVIDKPPRMPCQGQLRWRSGAPI